MDKDETIVVDRLTDLKKQLNVARAQRIEAESLNGPVDIGTTTTCPRS